MWSNPSVQVTPEYLAEDNSGKLLKICITFLVIETVFIALLYAARIVSTEKKKTNWAMIFMMTGAYTVCVTKITVALCKLDASYLAASIKKTNTSVQWKSKSAAQVDIPQRFHHQQEQRDRSSA